MENAQLRVYAYVKMDLLESTVPLVTIHISIDCVKNTFINIISDKKFLFNYTAICDEQCSLHGGVCDNGVCEFRCSDYAGYTCQNSSKLVTSLLVCKDVLEKDMSGQHCAPREPSILQQLEEVVVMPNYNRLFPGGARKLFNIFGNSYCDEAAKRLACWVSNNLLGFVELSKFLHDYRQETSIF